MRFLQAVLFILPFLFSIPIDAQQHEVIILHRDEALPEGLTRIAEIKVTDGGLKDNCGYWQTIWEAKEKAIAAGCNVLKITRMKTPDGWSTCYRMKADAYYVADISNYQTHRQHIADSAFEKAFDIRLSRPFLITYRPKLDWGSRVQYNLHIDDSVVCRVKNGKLYIGKLKHTGSTAIWAQTGKRSEVTIDVQPESVYYLRCTVEMDSYMGHPKLEAVSAYDALSELGFIDYETSWPKEKDDDIVE